MTATRHQRGEAQPATHRNRDQPVGPVCPVANLAVLVVPPAVRRPASSQATRVIEARHQRREGQPPTHRHRRGQLMTARPAAQLAVPVVSPAVRRPARCQATGVMPTSRQRREGQPTTHRHRSITVDAKCGRTERTVAQLAGPVVPPAVRRPARHQATGVIPTRHEAGEGSAHGVP